MPLRCSHYLYQVACKIVKCHAEYHPTLCSRASSVKHSIWRDSSLRYRSVQNDRFDRKLVLLPLSLVVLTSSIIPIPLSAQTPNLAQIPNANPATSGVIPSVPPQDLNQPSPSPIPSPQTPPLPSSPPEDLLQTPPSLLEGLPNIGTGSITVEKFEFTGNTVFSSEELAQAIKLCIPPQSPAEIQIGIAEEIDNTCPESSTKIALSSVANQLFSLTQLYKITDEIGKFYAQQGYSTSGAIIELSHGLQAEAKVVTIKVIEGTLKQEGLEVISDGSGRLNANYVRSRLGIRESEPLNVDRLKEALLLLSLDPLIDNLSATLADGSEPGEHGLEVKYQEANSFNPQFSINNGRSPSVGTIQGQAVLTEANLLGIGDSLSIGYSKSEGSDNWNASYTLPINADNGTLGFTYSGTESGVIESPFEDIDKDGSTPDITSNSNSYELTLRQPIIRKIRGLNSEKPGQLVTFEEFALGLTASWRESQSFLLGIPFPLSSGADEDGTYPYFCPAFFSRLEAAK